MDLNLIKFHTMKLVNGMKYISKPQVEGLKHIVCSDLKVEKTERNFEAVEQAIDLYFENINNIEIFLKR